MQVVKVKWRRGGHAGRGGREILRQRGNRDVGRLERRVDGRERVALDAVIEALLPHVHRSLHIFHAAAAGHARVVAVVHRPLVRLPILGVPDGKRVRASRRRSKSNHRELHFQRREVAVTYET